MKKNILTTENNQNIKKNYKAERRRREYNTINVSNLCNAVLKLERANK